MVTQVIKHRETLLADPYRPGYHFAIIEDARTSDPNGAFYADGRYHFMYLYYHQGTEAFHWGHVSSIDLLHWRHHPDALTSDRGDQGCFSGGAFVDDDGTAYISYWKFPSKDGSDCGGVQLAYAKAPYEEWTRIQPLAVESISPEWKDWGVTRLEDENGKDFFVGSADASNIWKKDGIYYMQTGNKHVLDAYGRKPEDPEIYKGDWTDLFKSTDLKNWTYVHRFYQNPHLGPDWPDETEDNMCPSFLPLADKPVDGQFTDKWLEVFISHNRGAQYYIGNYDGETFYPTQHGRFSWVDIVYFAPELLQDHRNRQIGWSWLYYYPGEEVHKRGWTSTGTYSLPRVFWYEKECLHMAPIEELDRLQFNAQTFRVGVIHGKKELPVKNGESFRLRGEIDPREDQKISFIVRADEENGEYTELFVDLQEGILGLDTRNCGVDGPKNVEKAPFVLEKGEKLSVDIFVDKSVIEIFVNNRQAICRRAFPSNPHNAKGVYVVAESADFGTLHAYEMMETNPY